MIRNQNIIDRLYLSQGNEDCIYIDDYKVPQTSLEGLRFLYRQFRHRKNGVILNDPYSFGRNCQIVLFLKAVRPLLTRPVLILCQEGSERNWIDRFDTWCASLVKDVKIETENPHIKKMVIINTMVNLHKFCEREWSIIIVDGDHVTAPNPILKLPFKACFKIWNTEVNMKENLDRFEEVYKWICPREIFDKYFFIPERGNAADIIEKSIMLDSFFEEIVLRRSDPVPSENHTREAKERGTRNTLTIFGPNRSTTITVGNTTIRPAVVTPKEAPVIVGDTIITRKPVDPTKGLRVVGDTTITPSIIVPSVVCSRTIGQTTITPTKDTIMTVCDTSITATSIAPVTATSPVPTVTISKKNKDATGTKIKRSKTRIESETANKLFESPIAVLAKLLEESPKSEPGDDGTVNRIDYCIENFSKTNSRNNGQDQSMECSKDETKTDKLIEVTKLGEKSDGLAQAVGDKLVEMDMLVFGHDTLISQVSDSDVPEKGNTDLEKKEIEPHTILTCKPVGESCKHNKLFTDTKKSINTVTSKTSAKCSDKTERDEKNDITKIKVPSPVKIDEPKVDIIKINLDELNREMRHLGTRDKPERLTKRQKITDCSETATCYNEIRNKFNEMNKETSVSCIKLNAEQVANSLKRNNIDVKMKECEEIVSKKFKGSLLDSLF